MLLVDAHVHVYDCFDLEKFFTSAHRNFRSQACPLGAGGDFTGILLLAETSRDNWFDRRAGFADGKGLHPSKIAGNWSVNRTGDDRCLEFQSGREEKLYVMAGRQIVTAEGLEVLALATRSCFDDGLPIQDGLSLISNEGALPVLPWGFGKWNGRRGRVLDELLSEGSNSKISLGDNGGRAGFLGEPRPFKTASRRGYKVLPGSDPLPFAFEQGRAGSFGFWCNETISADRPAEDLLRILRNPQVRINPYGKLEKPLSFLFKQVAMQVRKLKAQR